jgi:hypothetical protein
MGGSPKPKRPSNAERNAAEFAAKRSSSDVSALREAAAMRANARKRNPLFGGPEGTTLGVGASRLGVN